MGIGIVLLFWLFLGAIATIVGVYILRALTAALTRGIDGSKQLVRFASWLPVAGFFWFVAVFVLQAVVSDQVFHTDPGIGDSWRVPLPNGYVLGMIDVTDRGFVFNPKTVPPDGMVGQDDNVGDVTGLQVSGPYLLGRFGADNHYNNARFFLIDTRTGERQLFSNDDQLMEVLKPLGLKPDFSPISDVYSRYHWGWFNDLVLLLFVTFPAAALAFLASRIIGLRRRKIGLI